jgi:hypothetical protein
VDEEKTDKEGEHEVRLDRGFEGEEGGNEVVEGPGNEGIAEVVEGRGMRTRGAITEPGHYWNLAGKPR